MLFRSPRTPRKDRERAEVRPQQSSRAFGEPLGLGLSLRSRPFHGSPEEFLLRPESLLAQMLPDESDNKGRFLEATLTAIAFKSLRLFRGHQNLCTHHIRHDVMIVSAKDAIVNNCVQLCALLPPILDLVPLRRVRGQRLDAGWPGLDSETWECPLLRITPRKRTIISCDAPVQNVRYVTGP